MCVHVCMRDTSICVSSFFHHIISPSSPSLSLTHTHNLSLSLPSLPLPLPFSFYPLPPLALHLHFLSLFFPLPIICTCRCAPDLHSNRYPPEEPAPWFIRVDWSLTFHDGRSRFFKDFGWRYWYYYSWLVSLSLLPLLTHPHTHGNFPRPEYSSTALLYLHSVPFDVVSEINAGILKSSFDLDQNEQEFCSISEFLGKPFQDIHHILTILMHTYMYTNTHTQQTKLKVSQTMCESVLDRSTINPLALTPLFPCPMLKESATSLSVIRNSTPFVIRSHSQTTSPSIM